LLNNRSRLLATAAMLSMFWASTTSLADEKQADTCLRTKIWDGYAEGWGIRTITSATLNDDDVKVYLVTLYKGNEYQIRACGDESSQDITVALYDVTNGEKDEAGNPVPAVQDDSVDREPLLHYTPDKTGTYYIAIKVSEYTDAASSAAVAMAVTYR
jgi:hypothetical protein